MKPFLTDLEALKAAMVSTEQIKGLNVLEHGLMVANEYSKILNGDIDDEFLISMYELLKDRLLDDVTMNRYHIYHDCGKPLVLIDGRFPDHALASSSQWRLLFPEDEDVIELMKLDMEFHTKRGDEILELWKHPLAPSLYITAWAELYANSSMFGGTDSDSFKIKRKRLIQAGKKCSHMGLVRTYD